MLEIIALIFLSKYIGDLAARKGLKRGWWRFYMVLSWFGGEILGIVIMLLMVPDNMILAILVGYGLSISSYFILKARLNNMPDAGLQDDISRIGTRDLHP